MKKNIIDFNSAKEKYDKDIESDKNSLLKKAQISLCECKEEIINALNSRKRGIDESFIKDIIEVNFDCLGRSFNLLDYIPTSWITGDLVCHIIGCFESWDKTVSLQKRSKRLYKNVSWFFTIISKKPEAITKEMLEKLAKFIRFSDVEGVNHFLEVTPDEYKTPQFYYNMCLKNEVPVMKYVPEDLLTEDFLLSLIKESEESILSFTEEKMQCSTQYELEELKMWQIALRRKPDMINFFELTPEVCKYFQKIQQKNSFVYQMEFLPKKIKKEWEDTKEKEQFWQKVIKVECENKPILVCNPNFDENEFGIVKAGEQYIDFFNRSCVLPVIFSGDVPKELEMQYDQEEYLRYCYENCKIKVLGRVNRLYYYVELPEGWRTNEKDDQITIVNHLGKEVFKYTKYDHLFDETVKFASQIYYINEVEVGKMKTCSKKTNEKIYENKISYDTLMIKLF